MNDYERGYNDGKFEGRREMWEWFTRLCMSTLWLAGYKVTGMRPWDEWPPPGGPGEMPDCPEKMTGDIAKEISKGCPEMFQP